MAVAPRAAAEEDGGGAVRERLCVALRRGRRRAHTADAATAAAVPAAAPHAPHGEGRKVYSLAGRRSVLLGVLGVPPRARAPSDGRLRGWAEGPPHAHASRSAAVGQRGREGSEAVVVVAPSPLPPARLWRHRRLPAVLLRLLLRLLLGRREALAAVATRCEQVAQRRERTITGKGGRHRCCVEESQLLPRRRELLLQVLQTRTVVTPLLLL